MDKVNAPALPTPDMHFVIMQCVGAIPIAGHPGPVATWLFDLLFHTGKHLVNSAIDGLQLS